MEAWVAVVATGREDTLGAMLHDIPLVQTEDQGGMEALVDMALMEQMEVEVEMFKYVWTARMFTF